MPGRIGALAAVLAFACALGIASLAPDGVGASTPDPRRQLLRIRGQRPTSTVQQGRQSRPPPRKRKKKRRGDPPLPPAPPPPPQVCRRSDLTGCVARGNSHINGQINELNRTNLYELAYESHYDNVYNRTTEGVIQRCETKSDCNHGKLCVDGVCKCPVLFRGSDDCTVQTKLKFWWCGGSRLHNRFFKILTNCPVCRRKHYFSHLWIARTNFNDTGPEHGQDIVDMADFSTCAVVGGAGSRAKNGVDIDKHTAVIRCNDAPTKHPYGKIVGRRTTLRVQNQVRSPRHVPCLSSFPSSFLTGPPAADADAVIHAPPVGTVHSDRVAFVSPVCATLRVCARVCACTPHPPPPFSSFWLRMRQQDYAGWNEHKGEFCLPYTLQDHRIDRHPSARRFSGCNGTVVSDYVSTRARRNYARRGTKTPYIYVSSFGSPYTWHNNMTRGTTF